MSNDPIPLSEIRRQLQDSMKDTNIIEKTWEEEERKAARTRKKSSLKYDMNQKDSRDFKSNLKSIDLAYKTVMERINSIALLAAAHPDGMDSLPMKEYREINTLRLEAMMFDTTEVLKLIAISTFKITGEQALCCAYSIQRLQSQAAYLEKMIDEIGKNVDIDLSDIRTKMSTLKSTLDSEEVSLISSFVKDTNQKISEYKKKMAENDLAT